jgi:polyribonucleotide nucleotidyltransferase
VKSSEAPSVGTSVDPDITVNMSCPQAKVAAIIGKKGAMINAIMKKSGCRVTVDQNFPFGTPRLIHLTGSATGLAKAMTLITQVMEGNYSNIQSTLPAQSSPILSEKKTSSSTVLATGDINGSAVKYGDVEANALQLNMNSIATVLKRDEFAESPQDKRGISRAGLAWIFRISVD